MCGSVRLMRPMRPLCGSMRPKRLMRREDGGTGGKLSRQSSLSSQRIDLFWISMYCGFHMAWIVWPTAVNTTRPRPKS